MWEEAAAQMKITSDSTSMLACLRSGVTQLAVQEVMPVIESFRNERKAPALMELVAGTFVVNRPSTPGTSGNPFGGGTFVARWNVQFAHLQLLATSCELRLSHS